jgi:hypothetical protein
MRKADEWVMLGLTAAVVGYAGYWYLFQPWKVVRARRLVSDYRAMEVVMLGDLPASLQIDRVRVYSDIDDYGDAKYRISLSESDFRTLLLRWERVADSGHTSGSLGLAYQPRLPWRDIPPDVETTDSVRLEYQLSPAEPASGSSPGGRRGSQTERGLGESGSYGRVFRSVETCSRVPSGRNLRARVEWLGVRGGRVRLAVTASPPEWAFRPARTPHETEFRPSGSDGGRPSHAP